ncbi:MAG: thermonuclease family protein [Bauldia sp.]|nr:thermonuclease family protein [Bauldia sp.]
MKPLFGAAVLSISIGIFHSSTGAAQPVALAVGESITGRGVAIESDVLGIDGTVMSLWGIEGPLKIQPCFLDNRNWDCGLVAHRELEIILDGGPATCTRMEDNSFRARVITFARCTVNGVDVSAEMVRRGMAMAYPDQSADYVALQAEAEAAKAGLWKAQIFEPPWVWEENRRGGER